MYELPVYYRSSGRSLSKPRPSPGTVGGIARYPCNSRLESCCPRRSASPAASSSAAAFALACSASIFFWAKALAWAALFFSANAFALAFAASPAAAFAFFFASNACLRLSVSIV